MQASSRERVSIYARAIRHVIEHPRQVPTLTRWLRDRRASPLDLRIPWWPYTLPPWLANSLPAGARVYEFGAGGSTLWLEDQGFSVTSVESDPGWFTHLRRCVRRPSTDVVLIAAASHGSISSSIDPGYFDGYVSHISQFADDTFDLVVIDGRCRVAAGTTSMTKVRPGGLLLLDDSARERYGPLRHALSDWEAHTFLALRPGGTPPSSTTIWRKPIR